MIVLILVFHVSSLFCQSDYFIPKNNNGKSDSLKFYFNNNQLKQKEKLDISEIQNIQVVSGFKAQLLYGSSKVILINGERKLPSPFLISITPNEFEQEIKISFHLDRKAQIKIQVYNDSNKLLTTIEDKVLNPALHHYDWKPSKEISKGIYTILIYKDLEVFRRTVIKTI